MTGDGVGQGSDGNRPGSEAAADLSRRNIRLGAVVLVVLVGIVGISLVRGAWSSGAPPLTGALRSALEQDSCTVDERSDPGRMPTALAATSWQRRLLCPDGAAGPIGNFVTTFRNHGPEKGFV